MPLPHLPAEIIYHILECIICSPSAITLKQSDPATKDLLSCTLVSSVFHHIATSLLYAKCLHIATPRQLTTLVQTLTSRPDLAKHVTSLYLFTDSLACFQQVAQLLTISSPTLRRLVLNTPLYSNFAIETETDLVVPVLWTALETLTTLEEFVSVQDDLCLPMWHPEVVKHKRTRCIWPTWPRLRRLALYDPIINDVFVSSIQPTVERIVVTRPDFADARTLDFPSTVKRIIFANNVREEEYALNRDYHGLWDKRVFGDGDMWENINDEPALGFWNVSPRTSRGWNIANTNKIAQQFIEDRAISGDLWDGGVRMLSIQEQRILHNAMQQREGI